MAFDMLDYIAKLRADTGLALNIRVGLASGRVTAGVIGTRKFSYDVWGEPVNLASRLEGQAAPGRILICPASHTRLIDTFEFEPRGPIEIKGIGAQETWYLVRERALSHASDEAAAVTPTDRRRARSAT
jgi:adenylate cyclase